MLEFQNNFAPPALASSAPLALTIDDALDDIRRIDAFIAYAEPIVAEVRRARADRLTVVAQKMALLEATFYNGAACFASWEQVGRTAPEVLSPAILRGEIMNINAALEADGHPPLVPQSFIDEALPYVQPEPYVKCADIRKLRKLSKFGTRIADLLKKYIRDGEPKTALVVTPNVVDVTPARVAS